MKPADQDLHCFQAYDDNNLHHQTDCKLELEVCSV